MVGLLNFFFQVDRYYVLTMEIQHDFLCIFFSEPATRSTGVKLDDLRLHFLLFDKGAVYICSRQAPISLHTAVVS